MEARISDPSDSYVVIYDAAAAGFHTWPFSLFGLLFVAFGITAYLVYHNGITARERLFGRVAAPFAGVVGLLWTVAAFTGMRGEYSRLVQALARHRYTLVEGVITDFVPQGADGHPAESWQVDGHHYRLSTYEVTSGLGQPGVVHPGEYVRIADVDGTIARIERRVKAR